MKVSGVPELKTRLKAIKLTFKAGGREWADEAALQMRSSVPSRTGNLRRSFKRKSATQRRATVVGHYTAFFVSGGSVAHPIEPRRAKALVFRGRRNTIFAKKVEHPRIGPRPFRIASAEEALRRRPLSGILFRLWNRAA